jgi:hypothetical protein
MEHKQDGIKSIAINEFPVMLEDMIETFHVDKIEKKRKLKDKMLLDMLLEQKLQISIPAVENQDLSQLIIPQNVRDYSAKLLNRLPANLIEQETYLMELSFPELMQIVSGESKSTSYKSYRAKQIVNKIFESFTLS